MKASLSAALAFVTLFASGAQAAETRWSTGQARAWYAKQAWLTGADFVPADAINQLEMWQSASWNPTEIDRELGWAHDRFGMNTMRVFLHDLAWQQDPSGFRRRVNTFLAIAARHGIKPVFVLFDSCWDPNPKLGPQHAPLPGIHNSGWVQSPGRAALMDPAQEKRLQAYVADMVGSFGRDPRLLAWDVWNEPDNTGGGSYDTGEDARVKARVAELLPRVFAWARAAHPIQPLTSGVWTGGDWSPANEAKLDPVPRIQLDQSDVISFHNYGWPEDFAGRVAQLKLYGRPILCTEWMARSAGSTVDTILPIGRRENVGMINWGFVRGKTQTNFPWESWDHPYVQHPPVVWFHDLVEPDGTPYRAREADIFLALRARPLR
ncbi:MAG TPA: cellulase family glycosylhydrolase [Sphingomonas sp.]|uniref:cellulase family glycosylhydrolase n=1 Tax=Sphingomonas sp. TaxID=28214 RepID=UPI002BDAE154|nr:cellulase family glycosylhydrolase [Sphingomonas sp.]HMI19217.1 cellulase family glycosylhydrolase [Sphingomonas sp.]